MNYIIIWVVVLLVSIISCSLSFCLTKTITDTITRLIKNSAPYKLNRSKIRSKLLYNFIDLVNYSLPLFVLANIIHVVNILISTQNSIAFNIFANVSCLIGLWVSKCFYIKIRSGDCSLHLIVEFAHNVYRKIKYK